MQLQARISIIKESDDKSFYYTTDHEEVKNWGLAFDGARFEDIKVGTKITIEGEEYTIKSFKVEIHSDTDNAYGVVVDRAGKGYPYNFRLIFIVND